MKLIISPEIAQAYPDLRIGVLVAKGIDNSGKSNELEAIKREKTGLFRQNNMWENLQNHTNIIAWRDTYKSFGVKPKKSPPTAEALIRRILKGHDLPTISKAVDLYLLAELEFLLPVGGYDLDRVTDFISLCFSPGGESFIPLGASQAEESTDQGEIIYKDAERVLTRKWNYRDCDFCKITEGSTNIALFTEATFPVISTGDIEGLTNRIQEYVIKFCGGEVTMFIADIKDQLEWQIE